MNPQSTLGSESIETLDEWFTSLSEDVPSVSAAALGRTWAATTARIGAQRRPVGLFLSRRLQLVAAAALLAAALTTPVGQGVAAAAAETVEHIVTFATQPAPTQPGDDMAPADGRNPVEFPAPAPH